MYCLIQQGRWRWLSHACWRNRHLCISTFHCCLCCPVTARCLGCPEKYTQFSLTWGLPSPSAEGQLSAFQGQNPIPLYFLVLCPQLCALSADPKSSSTERLVLHFSQSHALPRFDQLRSTLFSFWKVFSLNSWLPTSLSWSLPHLDPLLCALAKGPRRTNILVHMFSSSVCSFSYSKQRRDLSSPFCIILCMLF